MQQEPATDTIDLREVYKLAHQIITEYKGGERLTRQINDYLAVDGSRPFDYVEKGAIESIQLNAAESVLAGLGENHGPSLSDMLIDQQYDIDHTVDVLHMLSHGMSCTKAELAEKLAGIYTHAEGLKKSPEDEFAHGEKDIADLKLSCQKSEHAELLAQSVVKAIQQQYGISSVAIAPRVEQSEGRA